MKRTATSLKNSKLARERPPSFTPQKKSPPASVAAARCDGIAAEPVRAAPEFRRLLDGAKAGLALIPKAIETRDGDLLHRVPIELKSFDNLLAFRFG